MTDISTNLSDIRDVIKIDTRGGNTSNPPRSRCTKWFSTISKESSKFRVESLQATLAKEDAIWAFQEEIGEGGFEHFQCCIKFKWGKKFAYVKELLHDSHIEICKNWDKAVEYCTKEDTRKSGTIPHTNIPGLHFTDPRVITNNPRFPWWNDLYMALRAPPDFRKLWWVKGDGDDGKTYFIRTYLGCHKDAIMVTGSAKDMQYAIASMETKPRIVFMNLTKSSEGKISYSGMEAIKDGLFFSSKYESGMVMMDPPHVVVMSNYLPDTSQMAPKRWNVIVLTHHEGFVTAESLEMDEDLDDDYPL